MLHATIYKLCNNISFKIRTLLLFSKKFVHQYTIKSRIGLISKALFWLKRLPLKWLLTRTKRDRRNWCIFVICDVFYLRFSYQKNESLLLKVTPFNKPPVSNSPPLD